MTRTPPTLALCLLCGLAAAQPLPVPPVEYGPDLPEPPQVFERQVAWNLYPSPNNIVLLLTVTNAATNYTRTVPVTQTNAPIVASFGSNTVSLSASNTVQQLESPRATLAGSFVIDRYQRLRAQAATNVLGPWTDVPLETMTNAPGYGFLRTYIVAWVATNWVER